MTYGAWGTRRRRPRGSALRLAGAAVVVALVVLLVARPQDSANAGPICIAGGTTVKVTADAKVSSAHPAHRYGRAGTWKVNYAPRNTRTLLMFPLPELPLQCAITEATLELHGSYSGTPRKPDQYPGANVNMGMVSRSWNESRVNWRNMPAGNACDGATQDFARPDSWSLTAIVQSTYHCLDTGRLPAWNGLKVVGWSPAGRGASWKLVAGSRESEHPPVVELAWG